MPSEERPVQPRDEGGGDIVKAPEIDSCLLISDATPQPSRRVAKYVRDDVIWPVCFTNIKLT